MCENFILLIKNLILNKNTLIAYSSEFVCLFGVFLNWCLLFLRKRKYSINKISNKITSYLFLSNILVLFVCFALNNQLKAVENIEILVNMSVNIFVLFFVLIVSKLTLKYRHRVALINLYLFFIVFFTELLTKNVNPFLNLCFFEAVILFVYRYSSAMRVRKSFFFSYQYLILNTIAVLVVFSDFFLLKYAHNSIFASVLCVVLNIGICLQIGIFPVCNYLIDKKTFSNFPYAILLNSFLPFLGLVLFKNLSTLSLFNSFVYKKVFLLFLMLNLIVFAYNYFVKKNILKVFNNLSLWINSFGILYFVLLGNFYNAILFPFLTLSLYSLIAVVKLNNLQDKFKIVLFNGLYYKNILLADLLAIFLLFAGGLIPSVASNCYLEVAKNLILEKNVVVLLGFLISLILITAKNIKLISKIYSQKITLKGLKIKRTAFNLAVPFVVLMILIVKIFL